MKISLFFMFFCCWKFPQKALATEIILTLGEAFEVAYEMAVAENSAEAEPAASGASGVSQRRGSGAQSSRNRQSYSTLI